MLSRGTVPEVLVLLPSSLSSRIYTLALLLGVAVLVLAGMLLTATERTRTGFQWAQHTQEVMRTAAEMRGDIREAESGQRSFLLTHSTSYLSNFDAKVERADRLARRLVVLTKDDPEQHEQAKRLQALLSARVTVMRGPLALGREGRFDAALALISVGKGKAVMDQLSLGVAELMAAERRLLAERVEAAQRFSTWTRLLLLVGIPVLILLFAALVHHLVSSVRRPVRDLLQAMAAFGEGKLDARAPSNTGTREFDQLASSHNEMADMLSAAIDRQRISDENLQAANVELKQRGEALAARGRSTELLAAMAHRMQACITDEELTVVLQNFLPRVFSTTPGALYAHNNSRNLLVKQVEWGDPTCNSESFGPSECWGLRRGQGHIVEAPGADIVCSHLGDCPSAYRCQPVLAGGEVVGLLYLEGQVDAEEQFRLSILTENIALSLVNHRLQRGLREQSIRDPLTNLFNRRYMEEALAIEAARSLRAGTNIGIVMCDIDHFKRFNDVFGHEAGDVLLKAVGVLIRFHFRDGDIACRYGGEEFAIIAPAADLSHLAARAERLRQEVTELAIQHQGRALGEVSMSFGIASMPVDEEGDVAEILRAADGALYRAKAKGRNRVFIAESKAATKAVG